MVVVVVSDHPVTETETGEIRVGPGFQARLPDLSSPPDERRSETLEELRWAPGQADDEAGLVTKIAAKAPPESPVNRVSDCDLIMYLRAARSMAAFVGMCDGGSAEDGCYAASRDDTTINALELLHENNYDTAKALQALVKNPVPKGIEKKWTDEDQKRFVKGLRQCGKNFFKIRKELLPQKETSELVEFYYLWKKSPQAASTRYHRRHRRQTVLRRAKTPPVTSAPNQVSVNKCLAGNNNNNNNNNNENNDLSSASEDDESDDSDSRDTNAFSCSHCSVTTSKDWQRGGKDNGMVCTDCRIFWKKNGEMRPLTDSPYLFKPVSEEDATKHAMRTRRSRDSSKSKSGSKSEVSPERAGDQKNGSKSPIDQKTTSTKRSSLAPAATASPKLKKRKEEEKPDDDSSEKPLLDDNHQSENENQKNGEDGESLESECSKSQDSTPPPESGHELEKSDSTPPDASPLQDDQSRAADLTVKREDVLMSEETTAVLAEAAAVAADPQPGTPDVPTPDDVVSGTSDDRVDSESCLPPCPPLITPKTEPPASPPTLTADHHHRNPHLVHPAAQHASVDPLPHHRPDDRSPVRIKEELGMPVAMGIPSPALPVPGPRISSPSRRNERSSPDAPVRHSFPFAGTFSPGRRSSPLAFAPARDLQQERERDARERERDRERERERRPSSESRSRTPREKNSESPRPPVISSFLSPYPGMGIPQMVPPHSRPQDMPPTTMYSMMNSLSQADQRLPPGMMHPAFAPHLMSPHPGLGPPAFGFLPPGMPPYYSPHWFPPRHMSFPPAVPSPSSAASSIKPAKSPVNQSHPAPAAPFQPHLLFPKESDHRDHRSSDRNDRRESLPPEDEDQDMQPNIVRGPSPEPKVDDSEFHRSQAAIFLKHWNRGDFNSCARTDLTFKPVPDSALARKREERARKAADKEREEQKKLAAEKMSSSNSGSANTSNDPSHHLNPYDRQTPRNFPGSDPTPALRTLSEYSRQHHSGGGGGLFSPGFPRTSLAGPMPGQPPTPGPGSMPGLSLAPPFPPHGPGMDPLFQYHASMAGIQGMFGPMERARIEEEREKRDRDMKEMEMKSRMASLSAAQQSVPAFEAQMAEYQRRFGQMPPHFGLSAFPPGSRERLGLPHGPDSLHSQQMQEQNERMAAAALSDPLAIRLQMANLAASELQHHAHTHAHTHAHAHTHLHLHPHDAAAAMAGQPPGLDSAAVPSIHAPHPLSLPPAPPGMRPPPGLMPRTGDLMHPAAGLFRPQLSDELLAQQISNYQHHEQMQRMLMDRDRVLFGGPGNPHPFG